MKLVYPYKKNIILNIYIQISKKITVINVQLNYLKNTTYIDKITVDASIPVSIHNLQKINNTII